MRLHLSTPSDFSYTETLNAHGWPQLLPFYWREETQVLERIERLADGRIVLISISDGGDNSLAIDVSEDAPEEELTQLVKRMFQLDLPIDKFHAFCQQYPELSHIPERQMGRMLRSPTLWEDVVKVIATTNTTWTQTKSMTARLVDNFGSPLPSDPTRHAFPSPQQIAAIPFDDFCAIAKLGYRNASVHGLATDITNGTLDLEAYQSVELDTVALTKKLLALRGVGPYAAACLMLYLGRPERVNVDSWARMLLSKELSRPVSDKEVTTFFANYGEWRGLVYTFYNWREGE